MLLLICVWLYWFVMLCWCCWWLGWCVVLLCRWIVWCLESVFGMLLVNFIRYWMLVVMRCVGSFWVDVVCWLLFFLFLLVFWCFGLCVYRVWYWYLLIWCCGLIVWVIGYLVVFWVFVFGGLRLVMVCWCVMWWWIGCWFVLWL